MSTDNIEVDDDPACDCGHLESSHADVDASNEGMGYVMDPRPCRIPNCPCGDFQP